MLQIMMKMKFKMNNKMLNVTLLYIKMLMIKVYLKKIIKFIKLKVQNFYLKVFLNQIHFF